MHWWHDHGRAKCLCIRTLPGLHASSLDLQTDLHDRLSNYCHSHLLKDKQLTVSQQSRSGRGREADSGMEISLQVFIRERSWEHHLGTEREGSWQGRGRKEAVTLSWCRLQLILLRAKVTLPSCLSWNEAAIGLLFLLEQSLNSGLPGEGFSSVETTAWKQLGSASQGVGNESSIPESRSGWCPLQRPPHWWLALGCLLLKYA